MIRRLNQEQRKRDREYNTINHTQLGPTDHVPQMQDTQLSTHENNTTDEDDDEDTDPPPPTRRYSLRDS